MKANCKLVDDPSHIVASPAMVPVGSGFTVSVVVVALQPEDVSVKVKETVPAEIAVINPALSIVATVASLLTHVPPLIDVAFIVAPTHNVVCGRLTTGNGFTVTEDVVATQPVDVSVKVKVTEPAEIAVIKPVLSIVATAGLLLTHVPPVPGEAFMVEPTHNEV